MNNNTWEIVSRKRRSNRNRETGRERRETLNRANNILKRKMAEKNARNKILYNFYHYNELPDELFIVNTAKYNDNNDNNNDNNIEKAELLNIEDVKKVQNALINFFREGYLKYVSTEKASDTDIIDYINNILITYGIKISGGFILKSMGLFSGNTGSSSIDIDIYAPYISSTDKSRKKRRTIKLHKLLYELFNADRSNTGIPVYKYFKVNRVNSHKSIFFRKNGIYSVTKYVKFPNAEMDIVQSDSSTTPIKIIQRFDLSFCQNWYDGVNLWSMDRKGVYKEDMGTLEDSYVELFLGKNPVTLKRIAKYISRGFRVKYKDPSSGTYIEIHPEDCIVRNEHSPS